MRYHFKLPENYGVHWGEIYKCDHPVYNTCTLFCVEDIYIAVIQQYYNPKTKHTYWASIDKRLNDILYLQPGFYEYVMKNGGIANAQGLYPTVTVRKLMWALKMKPLPKHQWETTFDRARI